MLAKWISPDQRGFVPGRQMLDNVMELEQNMMVKSLTDPAPLAVLIDFKAAFPSVAHQYLHGVMADLGVPQIARNVLAAFYDQGKSNIVHAGSPWEGFDMKAGIR